MKDKSEWEPRGIYRGGLPDQFLFYPYAREIAPTVIKDKNKAAIARGLHLYPFRTEKLNPAAPMVLRKWESR